MYFSTADISMQMEVLQLSLHLLRILFMDFAKIGCSLVGKTICYEDLYMGASLVA